MANVKTGHISKQESTKKYEILSIFFPRYYTHESLLFQSIQTFKEDLDFLFKRPKRTFPYDTSCQLRSFPGTARNFDDTAPAYKDIQISQGMQELPLGYLMELEVNLRIEFKFGRRIIIQ